MRKIKKKSRLKMKLLLIIVYLFYYIVADAQESNFQILEKININIENIKDFTFYGSNFFILTQEKLYTLNTTGNITNSENINNNITGICWNYDKLLFINTNGSIINKETDTVLVDLKIEGSIKKTKFLTANESNYFTYILIGDTITSISYSSKIISINSQGNESFFTYLVGLPAGLYCDNDYLWHLSNKSKKNEYGILRKYSISNGQLVSEEVLPVKDPIGLVIDNNGFIYTYSSITKEIYKIKKL